MVVQLVVTLRYKQVAGSIPDEVDSALTEMNTRDLSWGGVKVAGA
jgi:hypothetical protein